MSAVVDLQEVFVVHDGPDGGVAALRGLTLTVEPGELCVLLGPSGSGKTTLAHVLAGLERPSAGGAVVAGLDMMGASAAQLARHRAVAVGYADQHYWRALPGELTAEAIVALPLGLRGVARRERLARARGLLERVGLLERLDARPAELSGGEQQRLALCAALVHGPSLLIADEPTGELDARTARDVCALLAELVRSAGAAAVVVSHDPASTHVADRVVHVRDGRVSEEARGSETTVVVGRGGWLRVPEDALRTAGIGAGATVRARPGAIELRPTGAAAEAPVARPVPRAARGAVIEVRAVTRRFGHAPALARLDARFEPGVLTVVTGPSGSGKSTLLALLAGLDLPDEGDVLVDGLSLLTLDREQRAAFRRDHVAVVGQSAGLSGFLTGRENVELALALRGTDRHATRERAGDALTLVGLAEHADRPVDRLSGGERERVALARAIASAPAVLLADEPTARLDLETTLVVGRLLAELARVHDTTVVCATHDPALVSLAGAEVTLGPGDLARTPGRHGPGSIGTDG